MFGSSFTVVYDANVLYPQFLRDVLMRLALSDLFRARWSEEIHREWMTNLADDHPELTEKLPRIRQLMDSHVRDALVGNYEALIPGLTLPDPDDRHVLAAAIKAKAQVIVTFNLADFPTDTLAPYGIEAQDPDDFILDLIDLNPSVVAGVLEKHRACLAKPAYTAEEYCKKLATQRLKGTAVALRSLWI